MPAVNALGVFACALSPALVLGAVVVFPRPDRMILALTSAFVFVLAFMLTGIVWTVLTPLRGSLLVLALYATVFQELGRWVMYRCAVWLQRSLVDMRGISEHREASLSSPLAVFGERVAAATAIGVGIAATHGLLLTGRLLKDAASPGSLYVDGCALSRYALASLVALAFVALQVLWTIYAFVHAFPTKSPIGIALVAGTLPRGHTARSAHARHARRTRALIRDRAHRDCLRTRLGSHLLASSATFLNSAEGHPTLQCGGPTLGLLSLIVLAVGGLTAHAALCCIARLPLK
jgi:small-conductance mechanosensitive channel